jgi:hypothetical protein
MRITEDSDSYTTVTNLKMAKQFTPLSNPADVDRFRKATEEYFEKGEVSVKCDCCGQLIEFWQVTSTVWQHKCACGKYDGSLRRL